MDTWVGSKLLGFQIYKIVMPQFLLGTAIAVLFPLVFWTHRKINCWGVSIVARSTNDSLASIRGSACRNGPVHVHDLNGIFCRIWQGIALLLQHTVFNCIFHFHFIAWYWPAACWEFESWAESSVISRRWGTVNTSDPSPVTTAVAPATVVSVVLAAFWLASDLMLLFLGGLVWLPAKKYCLQ